MEEKSFVRELWFVCLSKYFVIITLQQIVQHC